MTVFRGSATAIVTPFDANGNVNSEALGKLIEFQIENGVDAIVACGTTGEASTLNDGEHIGVIRSVVKFVNKRVPVIAGVGSNDTVHGAKLTRLAEEAGADALLSVTPYYNKTTQKGLLAHYEEIAKATSLPIILYNIESRTGLNILPETMRELSKIDNVVGVKEASGDIAQVARIAAMCGEDFAIYSGNDDYFLPIMALGGKGVISTMGNIAPAQLHKMTHAFLDGDLETARKEQLRALALIRALFCEVNPVPVKAALNEMGFGVGGHRLPLIPMEEKNRAYLVEEMKKYGLL